VASVGRKVEQILSPAQRRSVGRLLVAIAACDGEIHKSELVALRKCYRILGLGADVLDQTLAELAPAMDEHMVTVERSSGPRDAGEPLPPRPDVGLRLDRQAISAIMAETRQVAQLLADAMASEETGDAATPSTSREHVAVATVQVTSAAEA